MRIAVIGGVRSTQVVIDRLAKHGFKDVHVRGYEPHDTSVVSGWVDLGLASAGHGFDYAPFVKVVECESWLDRLQPDVLFAVGLSQILPPNMLKLAGRGVVGFHPTALPRGRGRGAIAWLVLNAEDGAATFFSMQEGVDDGPIYVQEFFTVDDRDDASSVEHKLLYAEAVALDRWLPTLRSGVLEASEQDHTKASWYGRRAPEDGRVDWSSPQRDVLRLVRASTRPHPGAFTVAGTTVVRIWRAIADQSAFTGVVGRILEVRSDASFLVQAGAGLVLVTEWTSDRAWTPRTGMRLGLDPEVQLLQLKERCNALEARVEELARLIVDRPGRGNDLL